MNRMRRTRRTRKRRKEEEMKKWMKEGEAYRGSDDCDTSKA
jgi:hypothetical protein